MTTTQRFTITRAQRIEALRRQVAEGRLGHVGPTFPQAPMVGASAQRFLITRGQRIEALRRQVDEGRLGHVGPEWPEPGR